MSTNLSSFGEIDDNKVQYLASEMTKTYMVNKTSLSSEDFMKEYYEFYNAAIEYIKDMEIDKQKASTTGLSF